MQPGGSHTANGQPGQRTGILPDASCWPLSKFKENGVRHQGLEERKKWRDTKQQRGSNEVREGGWKGGRESEETSMDDHLSHINKGFVSQE